MSAKPNPRRDALKEKIKERILAGEFYVASSNLSISVVREVLNEMGLTDWYISVHKDGIHVSKKGA